MEGRRREDHVDRLIHLELREIGDQVVRAVTEGLAGHLDHGFRGVDAEDAAIGQLLQQLGRNPTRAAARVHHILVALQVQALEHLEAPVVLRIGDAVVGLGVPLPGPGVHRALGAHSEVVTGPESARPAASKSSMASTRSQRQRHVVEPVAEPVLDVLVDLELEDAVLRVDGLVVEVDPRLAGAGDRAAVLLVEDHRQQPVLRAVGIEDVRERGRDHRVEAVVLEAPDGVLAGGSRAEVPARDQDRVRLELDLSRAEPVVEEELAVARALGPLQELLGHDLVGVDVVAVEHRDLALDDLDRIHG